MYSLKQMYSLQIWPLGGATCISPKFSQYAPLALLLKFGYQVVPLELVPDLATSLRRLFLVPLALVPNWATRWCKFYKFQFGPAGGATCISCRIGYQVVLTALDVNLANSWGFLNQLQVWPPDGATLHQLQFLPSAGTTCIAKLRRIALLASSVGIEFLSSSAGVTVCVSKCQTLEGQPERSLGP